MNSLEITLGVVIVWVGFSVLAAVVAANKGRSAPGFFFLSCFLSPLVGLVAALVVEANHETVEQRKIGRGEMIRCPSCAELVRAEARICRYCNRDLQTAERGPSAEQWDRFVARLKTTDEKK